jgi:hypothetical protein
MIYSKKMYTEEKQKIHFRMEMGMLRVDSGNIRTG